MTTTLVRHEIDEDLFPELQQRGRERGVQARVIRGADERRLAAASARQVLLAVFRVGGDGQPAAWSLAFELPGADGRPMAGEVLLVLPPRDGNESETVVGDPSAVMPEGLIYRGAFWVDLDPWVARTRPPARLPMQLRYGAIARTPVQLLD